MRESRGLPAFGYDAQDFPASEIFVSLLLFTIN
jgi:hypothetical protein